MANVKEVRQKAMKITLNDGVERELQFTLNAMAELEELYGDADKAFAEMEKGSFKAIRAFLWAGLLHSDENLTIKQVGNLISIQDLHELVGTVSNAVVNDMPQAEQVETELVGVSNSQDPNE